MQKILLVDNSVSDAVSFRRALKAVNVLSPVIYVSDGADAMDSLAEMERKAASDPAAVPSILFLDLKLTTVSAFDILRHLRDRVAFSAMLKIVMADLTDMANVRKPYDLRANTFLTKPINAADLYE